MKKLVFIPVLLAIACLFSGTYGAVHNQISYTISPEYFTQFKFHQFQLTDSPLPNRLNAGIVGWNAAWWMGIIIGLILIPAGLVIRGAKTYFMAMIKVFGIVTITTLGTGLIALFIAHFTVTSDTAGELTRYGNDISNDVAFARAGTMHNFSYLGGLLSIFTGSFTIYWQRRQQKQNRRPLKQKA